MGGPQFTSGCSQGQEKIGRHITRNQGVERRCNPLVCVTIVINRLHHQSPKTDVTAATGVVVDARNCGCFRKQPMSLPLSKQAPTPDQESEGDISPPISSAFICVPESCFDDEPCNGSSWTSSVFRSPGSNRKVGRDELEGSAYTEPR